MASSTGALLGQILGSGVLGAGLLKGLDWLFNRRKGAAEADISEANAADVSTDVAAKMLRQVDERREMDRAERDVERRADREEMRELREEIAELRRKDRERDVFADRHTQWDRRQAERLRQVRHTLADALSGREISPDRLAELDEPLGDPPPLYLAPAS